MTALYAGIPDLSTAKKCGCFRRAEISLLYTQSNLQEILKERKF